MQGYQLMEEARLASWAHPLFAWHGNCIPIFCGEWNIPFLKEKIMNWDQIAGNWKQFAGKAKEKWGKLTDSDWTVIEGKRDQLIGRVEERYGIAKNEAEKQ